MRLQKIIPATLAALILAPAVWASDPSVSLDFGGQAVRGDVASSKFDEYIDIPRGFYVESLGLRNYGDDYYFRLDGAKPGFKDQSLNIETGIWGLHKFSLGYDQTPHNLSNSARTFLRNDGEGVFTLPDNLQSSLQTSTTNAAGFFPWAPGIPLRVDRTKSSLAYTYSPTGPWRVNLGYSAEKKDGQKNIGVNFGFQIAEAPEPVDYLTQDLNFGTEYVGKTLGWRANYNFSAFANGIHSLTVDNPVNLTDTAASASGSSTPGTARLALPPNNHSHQFSTDFSAKTTAKSHLNANASFTSLRQNDPFLPPTSNAVILSKARVAGFVPQSSLDGMVNTLNAALRWNWKPVTPVSVNVRAKHYDIDNRTPELTLERIPYDSSYSTGTPTKSFKYGNVRRSLPYSYDKTNAGADCYYSIAKPLSMKLAYDWERIGYDFFEAKATQEDIYAVSFKAGPFYDLVVRPSYQYARRIVKDYNEELHWAEESFPLGEGTALGEMPQLRKFDLAGRKRHKVTVRADWDPLDYLNAGVDYGLTKDDYDAEYGVQDGRTLYYSVDASVSPSDRLGIYADYSWEQMSAFTRSRYRSSTADDLVANDWAGVLKDTAHSVDVGVQSVLLKDKLDADLGWGMTYLKGLQQASNPGTITTASALATDFPNTYSRLQKLRASMRYRWSQSLTARLGYEYQRYTETDWSQDDLEVYQKDWATSVFLGAAQTGYEAHLISLGLSYAF
ncbi:MAG: hypothetical protein A3G41_00450 [Elusimicrobia bacterium RIFCSPLOWO2_12_FULL_59_9]|nr:MAG: hypothetical protein A3G41_00450 [Elusimicrobia bacterium RIFCSPLOWO2_12_FULL_59_9]